jgi:vesicle transport through interaction with t-SNAREs protein 1
MEIEIQSIPSAIRSQYHTRLRSAKADLQKFKKLLTDSRTQLARADLFSSKANPNGGFSSSDDPYASNDRTMLLGGTAILEQGTKRLQQSQQLALETETQGAEILLSLRSQREQIENSRDTVGRIFAFLCCVLNHSSASTSRPCYRSRLQYFETDG